MADSGCPLYLPLGFDPSLFVSADLIFPPYPQDFVIPAGYGWIPGPVMPLPLEFDLAFLSPSYYHAYACYLQPYAYHYPPPPAPPTQANDDGVYMGIPLLPGLAVVPQYLQPLQVNVTQVVAAGTGVFHPFVTSNYRAGTRRGHAAGRGRWNGHRRGEASTSSRDARASSQNNNTGTTSSFRGRKRR